MSKVVIMVCAVALLIEGFAAWRQTLPGYLNVLDYGVYGDGRHDDTPGILAALTAASKLQSGNFLYFPPTKNAYVLQTPLELPPVNKWTELYFDGPLLLRAPLTVNDLYIIHGNGATVPAQFSTNKVTNFASRIPNQSTPSIQVHGKWGVMFQNIDLGGATGGQDGFLIDGTSGLVTFDNVISELTSDNMTGSPLHIKGGGFIQINGGRYSSPAFSATPSVSIETDPDSCVLMGAFRISNAIFINEGVGITPKPGCGVFAQISIETALYQDGGFAFLRTVGMGGSLVAGVYLNNIAISDGTPEATCLNNTGRAWSFQVFNCVTGGNQPITSGDPILDLEVFSAGSQPIGQNSNYVYHGMNGIVSTMPTSNAPIPFNDRIVPKNWNFPKPPKGLEQAWDAWTGSPIQQELPSRPATH